LFEKTKAIADKANEAAAALEAQLNDSVGVAEHGAVPSTTSGVLNDDDDGFFQHEEETGVVWNDDVGGDGNDVILEDLQQNDSVGVSNEDMDRGGIVAPLPAVMEETVVKVPPLVEQTVVSLPPQPSEQTVVTLPPEAISEKDVSVVVEESQQGWVEEDDEIQFDDEDDVEDVDLGSSSEPIFKDDAEDDDNVEAPISPLPKEVDAPSVPVTITTTAPTVEEEPPIEGVTKDTPTSNGVHPANNDADESIALLLSEQDKQIASLQNDISNLQSTLNQREQQLSSKSNQLSSLQELFQSETETLQNKIRDTKEEAKRRIQRANDKLEEFMMKQTGEGGSKDQIIEQLREEGATLAQKQGQTEQQLRSVKREFKELSEELEDRDNQIAKAGEREKKLKSQLEDLKKELSAAKKSNEKISTLEKELSVANESSQKHSAINLTLEQEIKELKNALSDLRNEMSHKEVAALEDNQQATEQLKKERDEMLEDLQKKLRVGEREAQRREDSLRYEVTELRKRWQDSVRRADALSMDVQQSTAPLMRQLESTERQHRARAAAWAEMESKLRTDLESALISTENLTKDRTELQTRVNRLERYQKDTADELSTLKRDKESLEVANERLEKRMEEMQISENRIREEWKEVERLAKANQVRSDMMKSVMDSEERYRSELQILTQDLENEKARRVALEEKLESLVESSAMMLDAVNSSSSKSERKKLKTSLDQASILQDTLVGLNDEDDDDDDQSEEDDFINPTPPHANSTNSSAPSSFAAMEQLSQWLKGAELELETLRKQLRTSEETRQALLQELTHYKSSCDKLPLFEKRVTELTAQVRERDLEIQGLHDDIVEVKMFYRGQLDTLLEEKAANTPIVERPKRTHVEEKAGEEKEEEEKFTTISDVAAAAFDIAYDGE